MAQIARGVVYVKVMIEKGGEDYFRKAVRVDAKDKVVWKGLGELKEMQKTRLDPTPFGSDQYVG